MVSVHGETLSDQVLTLRGHSVSEPQLGGHDLLVTLEGNVSTDHVIEEDAQAPDRGQLTIVSVVSDPLWRCVDSGAVKVSVHSIPEMSSGTKVNQLQLQCLEVDQEVLVLDIPVNDSLAVTGHHCLQHLQ